MSWQPRTTAGGIVTLASLALVGLLVGKPFVESDTWELIQGADGLLRCLAYGAADGCPTAGKFAPLQLLIAVPLRALDVPHPWVGRVLAWLSAAAFLGLLRLTWVLLAPRSRRVALGAGALLISGLPLHFATHSFVELPAAFLMAWLAVGWLTGRAGTVGVAALLAALTKETAAPFIVLLLAVCAVVAPHPRRQALRLGAHAAVGLGVAVALSAALNVYRFGGPLNTMYATEASWGPDTAVWLRTWAALWLAPNGGLVFFFPGLVALLVALPWAVGPDRRWAPGLAVFGLLLAVTAALAHWWAPFGWWCFGQRLSVPFLPVAVLLLCVSYGSAYERALGALTATPARRSGTAVVVAVLGLPFVASLVHGGDIIYDTFTYGPGCGLPDTEATRAPYYACIARQAWDQPSPLLRAASHLPQPGVLPWAIAYVCLIGGVARVRDDR